MQGHKNETEKTCEETVTKDRQMQCKIENISIDFFPFTVICAVRL